MKRLFLPLSASVLVLTGCVANEPASNSADTAAQESLSVQITDDKCDVSANNVKAGRTSFKLANKGTVRNEFEILAEDKLRIVGERENLGPGTTTDYTVLLQPGTYYTACKTNMVGALVDVKEFTVAENPDAEVNTDDKALIDAATTNYSAYVRDQTGQLLTKTQEFAAAYKAGDVEKAKALYAPTRAYYERIEPTAESFGDIDPALDEREADFQEDDSKGDRQWTGWHVIEKDLWEGAAVDRTAVGDQLVADTQKLYDLVYSAEFQVNLDDISNGAIGLLEEVATSKITGEEEAFSHTDLQDFAANVEGAKVAFGNVEELAKQTDPDLAKTISARFTALEQALKQYQEGEGYVSYDKLDEKQRRELSDQVDALRVPLAKLTEAIVK
ncbi:iron uptake system protein EfeO [Corynebacterium sp. H128]|uniref:iron uptake system protein EfeO n=1 Tax=unclassified Corynebacterium TaxID=2624378 RepID=UPI0030B4415D